MFSLITRFPIFAQYEGLASGYLKADGGVNADTLLLAAESCKDLLKSPEPRVETQAMQCIARQTGGEPNEFCNPYRDTKYDAVMIDLLAAFEAKHAALCACNLDVVNKNDASLLSYEAAVETEEMAWRTYDLAICEALAELHESVEIAQRAFSEELAMADKRRFSKPVRDDLIAQ